MKLHSCPSRCSDEPPSVSDNISDDEETLSVRRHSILVFVPTTDKATMNIDPNVCNSRSISFRVHRIGQRGRHQRESGIEDIQDQESVPATNSQHSLPWHRDDVADKYKAFRSSCKYNPHGNKRNSYMPPTHSWLQDKGQCCSDDVEHCGDIRTYRTWATDR